MDQLRLYRHFSNLEDSQALLGLLRMNAIAFETTFHQQSDYYKIRTESARLEVWVRSTDYETVQQLEAALTPEQAADLARNYSFITASDEELQEAAGQQQFPEDAAVAQRILLSRKPYEPAAPTVAQPVRTARVASTNSPVRSFLGRYGVLLLLLTLFLLSYL